MRRSRIMHQAARWLIALSLVATPFAAVVRAQEDGVPAEAESAVSFVGQMIELSTTEAPTNIVVRMFDADGEGWIDSTVVISDVTVFGSTPTNTTVMTDWITGDWVLVQGVRNENTGVVAADVVVNQSINPYQDEGLNGWVTAIDQDAGTMMVQWAGVEHLVRVTERTKMVVPPINPATLTDFQVNDRVRLRMFRDGEVENEARIIVALRRVDHIFLKGRTRPFEAGVISTTGSQVPGEVEVALFENAHLRGGDVNNLIGLEGDRKTVRADENTRVVARYSGETTLDAILPGDDLYVIGRANDDGTITARLIRIDDLVHEGTNASGSHGKIVEIDGENRSLVLRDETIGLETVFVTDETVLWRNDGEAVWEDVQVGDIVQLRKTCAITCSADTLFAWTEDFGSIQQAKNRDLHEMEERFLANFARYEICKEEGSITQAIEKEPMCAALEAWDLGLVEDEVGEEAFETAFTGLCEVVPVAETHVDLQNACEVLAEEVEDAD